MLYFIVAYPACDVVTCCNQFSLHCLISGNTNDPILDEFKIAESAKSKAKLDPEVVAKVKAYGHQVSWTGARTVRLCDVF